MAKMIDVKIEVPATVMSAQNGRAVVVAHQACGGRLVPAGVSYESLDEAIVAAMERDAKAGRCTVKITRGVKSPKLDEITE